MPRPGLAHRRLQRPDPLGGQGRIDAQLLRPGELGAGLRVEEIPGAAGRCEEDERRAQPRVAVWPQALEGAFERVAPGDDRQQQDERRQQSEQRRDVVDGEEAGDPDRASRASAARLIAWAPRAG
ncbi:MAG: hypothetical protein E6G10_06535 [Actinobacteria bacterium]|nr:MAG: hypothetical protein E6G10_06535 [Actinomycetota bacterium]